MNLWELDLESLGYPAPTTRVYRVKALRSQRRWLDEPIVLMVERTLPLEVDR
jgi:hypothetical protein